MIEQSIVHLRELVKDIDRPVYIYLAHLSSVEVQVSLGPEHKRPGGVAGRTDALTVCTLGSRRLFVARVGWLIVAVLSVGLFFASVPAYYDAIVGFSVGELKSAAVRASLEASGVSIQLYAVCSLST